MRASLRHHHSLLRPLARAVASPVRSRAQLGRASSGTTKAAWNEEWRRIGLGAEYGDVKPLNRLMFVQCGFGCDQHGYRETVGATQAAIRACRNAIEFNSIPGMVRRGHSWRSPPPQPITVPSCHGAITPSLSHPQWCTHPTTL